MSSRGRISVITAWLVLALVLGAGAVGVIRHFTNGLLQVTYPESVSAGDPLVVVVTADAGESITVTAEVDGEEIDGSPDDGSDDPGQTINTAEFGTGGLDTGDIVVLTIRVGDSVVTKTVEVM